MIENLNLVLASQSPRRREILQNAGIPFVVRVANVPEQHKPGESPQDYVLRLARSKAEAVTRSEDEIVLGADTVVVVDGQILEKPRDAADAYRMLSLLSGRRHEVITGIALVVPLTPTPASVLRSRGRKEAGLATLTDTATTRVNFAPLTAEEIGSYVSTGEPMDKAGAYAIQGIASKYIESIEGCYFNVVGLPISLVSKHIKSILCTGPAASR